MKVAYDSGPRAVSVDGVQAERGKAVEVPDEVGRKLLKQGWREVKSAPPKKADQSAATNPTNQKEED